MPRPGQITLPRDLRPSLPSTRPYSTTIDTQHRVIAYPSFSYAGGQSSAEKAIAAYRQARQSRATP